MSNLKANLSFIVVVVSNLKANLEVTLFALSFLMAEVLNSDENLGVSFKFICHNGEGW